MLNPGTVSIIIPAFNEERLLGKTLDALIENDIGDEIIVVDDGSKDDTYKIAAERGVKLVRLPKNQGKGAAMNAGLSAALGSVILFLDADLGKTAASANLLIEAVKSGDADLAVATFPVGGGGFGYAVKMVQWSMKKLTGEEYEAPLCGQRAMKRELLEAVYPLRRDFGVESAMLFDALNAGYRVREVPVDMAHRIVGRSPYGYFLRGRQAAAHLKSVLGAFAKYKVGKKKKKQQPPQPADPIDDDLNDIDTDVEDIFSDDE